MEKLFAALREFLDAKEKEISKLETLDQLVALGDLTQEFGDIVAAFSSAANDALLNDPDGDGVDLGGIDFDSEPEYFPNFAVLAQAAVLTLKLRGDIVDQLEGAGYQSEAEEVARFIGSKGETETKTKKTKVKKTNG